VVDETRQYSAAEMERMMKVQDVLLKAMARKITWWAAAEILGVTDRTMRRWRERLEVEGYSGLADRRKGKPSAKRIPLATVEKVLALYRETYYDLNIRHFHEKLRDEHAIRLSYTWVQKALQGAGLVAKRRKPKGGFHRLPHSLGNLAEGARFPLFHRADYGFCSNQKKSKGQKQTQGGGLKAASLCFKKRTDHVFIKPDNLTC
jgi:transposase